VDNTTTGYAALDPCVHCGFCLPACPTYLVTGDENDSPRGRIVLMQALQRGDIAPTDAALRDHLGRCLGCRGCEPACPSGVGYGEALETARATLHQANRSTWASRLGLSIFSHPFKWRTVFGAARFIRATGLPYLLAGRGRLRFPMGMLAASLPRNGADDPPRQGSRIKPAAKRGTVALFKGCVMDTLFHHVNQATRRTLEANGFKVVTIAGQACCGAPLLHAGERTRAAALLTQAVQTFANSEAIVVNSAGCGVVLKEAGSLLETTAASEFAGKIRDVSELLAQAGPVPGAEMPFDVAYDPPCHLQHAQRIHTQVLDVLGTIPGLRVRVLPGADQCCGSAGIFNLQHPELASDVLDRKLDALRSASPSPSAVVTGNPGCVMQIGAGLKAAGLPIEVLHPVQLLDRSYREAGFYE